MLPLPATTPHGLSFASLPSNALAVSINVLPASPVPPVVLASSSDANSFLSSQLDTALLSVFSSEPLPSTRYYPPAPLSFFLAGGSSVVCLLPFAAVAVVSVASVFPRSAPVVPCVVPRLSLYLHSTPFPHLRYPLGSCVCTRHHSPFLPRPWPLILPVRKKISAIGWAGVKNSGRLQAGLCRVVISLTGPSP